MARSYCLLLAGLVGMLACSAPLAAAMCDANSTEVTDMGYSQELLDVIFTLNDEGTQDDYNLTLVQACSSEQNDKAVFSFLLMDDAGDEVTASLELPEQCATASFLVDPLACPGLDYDIEGLQDLGSVGAQSSCVTLPAGYEKRTCWDDMGGNNVDGRDLEPVLFLNKHAVRKCGFEVSKLILQLPDLDGPIFSNSNNKYKSGQCQLMGFKVTRACVPTDGDEARLRVWLYSDNCGKMCIKMRFDMSSQELNVYGKTGTCEWEE